MTSPPATSAVKTAPPLSPAYEKNKKYCPRRLGIPSVPGTYFSHIQKCVGGGGTQEWPKLAKQGRANHPGPGEHTHSSAQGHRGTTHPPTQGQVVMLHTHVLKCPGPRGCRSPTHPRAQDRTGGDSAHPPEASTWPNESRLRSQKTVGKSSTTLFRTPNPRRRIASSFSSGRAGSKLHGEGTGVGSVTLGEPPKPQPRSYSKKKTR